MMKLVSVGVLSFIVGLGLGYMAGHENPEPAAEDPITSFEECAAAGNPIMESYPEQCRTPDGTTFVREIPPSPDTPDSPESPYRPLPVEPVACTMDAKVCPDGSAVGRVAPNCQFAPCPGE